MVEMGSAAPAALSSTTWNSIKITHGVYSDNRRVDPFKNKVLKTFNVNLQNRRTGTTKCLYYGVKCGGFNVFTWTAALFPRFVGDIDRIHGRRSAHVPRVRPEAERSFVRDIHQGNVVSMSPL